MIGLCQVDGKIPNLALAKLAAWHKKRRDKVELYNPLMIYDKVYASKVFTDTPDNNYLLNGTRKGGSGYDLKVELEPEIEKMMPDFSLWPGWNRSIGFTTRGCVRKCPFCIVPEKEGKLKVVSDIYGIWNGSKELMLLDNNITAAPMDHFELICKQLIKENIKVDFNQGLDIRLVNSQHAYWLKRVKRYKRIRFAWDDMRIEKSVRNGIKILRQAEIRPDNIMFYVLVGYNSDEKEDLYRIEILKELGVYPFVMPYNRHNIYQKRLANWCNQVEAQRAVKWEDYRKYDRKVDGKTLEM